MHSTQIGPSHLPLFGETDAFLEELMEDELVCEGGRARRALLFNLRSQLLALLPILSLTHFLPCTTRKRNGSSLPGERYKTLFHHLWT